MYLDKVITGVRIFDPMATEPKEETFFVLEGSPHEAIEFIGLLRVEPQLVHNLVEWLTPAYYDEYVLLVSLDGRSCFPYPRNAIVHPHNGESVVDLGTKDDYSAHEVRRMVRDFKSHMSFNQELAVHLGYVQGLNPQKKRVRFTGVGADVRSGDIDRDIQKAMRSLESATDDSLVWLAIAGPKNQNAMYPFSYAEVMREIALRQSKGMEFRSTFFPLNRVSIEEIEQRHIRAELLHRVFNQKFHVEFGGIDFEKAIAWIRNLDTDMLGELAVYTYYSDAGRMGDWKYFVTEFQSRMKRTFIY